MRCLSPHSNYSVQVIEANEQIVVDARGFATSIVHSKPVNAEFQQGGFLDYEVEAALEHFNFSGIPDGVNPLTKIAVFDTEAYVQRYPKDRRDEMLVQIDQRLREIQEQHPSQFIIVEVPPAPRPWPSYDTDTVEEVLALQERLQVDPELVRKYEESHGNRAEVIQAMLVQENPELAEEYAEEHGLVPSEQNVEERISVDA